MKTLFLGGGIWFEPADWDGYRRNQSYNITNVVLHSDSSLTQYTHLVWLDVYQTRLQNAINCTHKTALERTKQVTKVLQA